MKNIWFALFWIMVGVGVSFLFGGLNLKNSSERTNNSSDGSVRGVNDISADNPSQNLTSPAKTTIDDDPYLGDKNKAKVALVEFSDYECPFCQKFHQQTFEQIVKEYVDTGKIITVYRDFPLDFHNPAATQDASAANCVQEIAGNKKYFIMMELIFQRGGLNGLGISKEKFIDLAKEIGLDSKQFSQCLDADKFQNEIAKDLADGQAAGIDGTPGFVIGKLSPDGLVEGVLVSGAQPYSVFQQVIESELDKL